MKIYIYAQHTLFAGEPVPQHKIENYEGDPEDCHDWNIYEGTPAELVALAREKYAVPATGPNEYFAHKVANSILSVLELEL